ncbi:hypothetical protein AY599_02320 [Leptolyngbya valderiana BDU 20041]|nr:hypothetical protein AY599_02320 [Leptolyngbya valderiana BDU 20041]
MPLISNSDESFYPLKNALFSLDIARALGFGVENSATGNARKSQQLFVDAPLLSELFDRRVAILGGWSDFQNSVKAFQVLGLLADTVRPHWQTLKTLKIQKDRGDLNAARQLEERQKYFLKTRQTRDRLPVFQPKEITSDRLQSVDLLYVALWEALRDRTLVCTTSSNFGLALHEILHRLQTLSVSNGDREFSILNFDDVKLTIWCPKRGSAIMRDEKDDILRHKVASSPLNCELRRYETRRERDVNAIGQVLEESGIFFPTTPQSAGNLTTIVEKIFREKPKLRDDVSESTLQQFKSPIQGGIFGAIVPYLYLLDAFIQRDRLPSSLDNTSPLLSLYNPTSIGATLAAFIEGDRLLRRRGVLSALNERERSVFAREFPHLKAYLEASENGLPFYISVCAVPDHHTRPGIAGAFNVTSRHVPGDGKKFMGLGSNGFPNNSVLKDIVSKSVDSGGAFGGKSHIYPTTHTMGYVAAALVFANDLQNHCNARLPELAGAFAVAGILQQAIEQNQLSPEEVAWSLKKTGIGLAEFLALNPEDYRTAEEFLKRANSEGQIMGEFAKAFVQSLSFERSVLRDRVRRVRSHRKVISCSRWPLVVAHRTGDYCLQPDRTLVRQIQRQQSNLD